RAPAPSAVRAACAPTPSQPRPRLYVWGMTPNLSRCRDRPVCRDLRAGRREVALAQPADQRDRLLLRVEPGYARRRHIGRGERAALPGAIRTDSDLEHAANAD